MNKSELISAIAAKTHLTKTQADDVYKALVATISEELAKNEQVSLIGFGTFLVRERQARTGRNPKTKETIEIPASKIPAFKAGKALKDAVN